MNVFPADGGRLAMLAGLEEFRNRIEGYGKPELIELAVSQYQEMAELRMEKAVNDRIYTDAHIQYADLRKKFDSVLAENKQLKKILEQYADKNTIQNKEIFGRKSETMDSLAGTAGSPAPDPLDEGAPDPDQKSDGKGTENTDNGRKGSAPGFHMPRIPGTHSGGKKGGGKTDSWLKGLPCELSFLLDADAMDEKFGKYKWSIAFWYEYDTVEEVPSLYYHKKVCVPVISVGPGFSLYRTPYNGKLLKGSYASASLISGFMYGRQGLSMPYYRQAVEAARRGLPITRQTITGWCNRLALDLFLPVYNHLSAYLIKSSYTQCDETTAQVIHDGRKAGSQSYMWVHVTSEHYTGHPVVIFSFELTRGTEHLRHFYQDYIGYITCDAYISYQVMESENPDRITVTGCMMHCRRYFAIAFFVNEVSSMTDAQVMDLPETKILRIFSEIYAAEKPLKQLTTEERLAGRKENVKPLVDKLFSEIRTLDQDDNVYSDRMQKAIQYALKQEVHLRRFLDDGSIPIDDGFTERSLRGYCNARKSFLFYDTTDGAEASAIIYSLVETAKLSHADPRLYLQYLLEKMPGIMDKPMSSELMEQMTPWSETYKTYERAKQAEHLTWLAPLFQPPEKPKTPRKKDSKCRGISSGQEEHPARPGPALSIAV